MAVKPQNLEDLDLRRGWDQDVHQEVRRFHQNLDEEINWSENISDLQKLLDLGYSYRDIGAMLGRSRQRIGQIVDDYNLNTSEYRGSALRMWSEEHDRFIPTEWETYRRRVYHERKKREQHQKCREHIVRARNAYRSYGRAIGPWDIASSQVEYVRIASHWSDIRNGGSYEEAWERIFEVAGVPRRATGSWVQPGHTVEREPGSVGEIITNWRESRNVTQKELAEALGVSLWTIRDYELGDAVPSDEELDTILEFLAEHAVPSDRLTVGQQYTSDEIYNILGLSHNSSELHRRPLKCKGEWFLAVVTESDPNSGNGPDSHWKGNNLIWVLEGSSSTPGASVVESIPNQPVNIFTRPVPSDQFTYQGTAKALEVTSRTPFTVIWSFDSESKHLGDRTPGELPSTKQYSEGAIQTIQVNSYERNRQARQECIQYWGAECVVCEIDFGERYGARGQGYIHVHHLTPLSEVDEEYTVDPIQDLRPVCPNCHAMIHRRDPPLSISELRNRLKA